MGPSSVRSPGQRYIHLVGICANEVRLNFGHCNWSQAINNVTKTNFSNINVQVFLSLGPHPTQTIKKYSLTN